MHFYKSKKRTVHNLFLAAFIFLYLPFVFSCGNANYISPLFEAWLTVESDLQENSHNLPQELSQSASYSDFLSIYKDFKASSLYQNLSSAETYTEILTKLDSAINNQDFGQIHTQMFLLEKTDKDYTFKSNQEYFFLSFVLMLVCLVISLILIFLFRQYEKKSTQAKQLGIYSEYMVKGIERERERISKEIHDTVLQDIKALSLKQEMIKSDNFTDNEPLKQELIEQTGSCIKGLRSICENLTPVEFKQNSNSASGFILALNNLINQSKEKSSIQYILKIQENLDLSSITLDQSINIFRILQEALNNVEEHSKATTVSVILSQAILENQKSILKLFITDNGIGFDSNRAAKEHSSHQKHFGLSNIKERAKYLGAKLTIISEINEGTEIKLEVPLK